VRKRQEIRESQKALFHGTLVGILETGGNPQKPDKSQF
jgi:hypothetical protein